MIRELFLAKFSSFQKTILLFIAHTVNFYQQFSRSLSTDDRKLALEEPIKNEDCSFLRQVYLPCEEDSIMLDLTSLSKEDIQSYGIASNARDSKNTRLIH